MTRRSTSSITSTHGRQWSRYTSCGPAVFVYSPYDFRPFDRIRKLSSKGVAADFTTTVELDTYVTVARRGKQIRQFESGFKPPKQGALPEEKGLDFGAKGQNIFATSWAFLERLTRIHVTRDWFEGDPDYVLRPPLTVSDASHLASTGAVVPRFSTGSRAYVLALSVVARSVVVMAITPAPDTAPAAVLEAARDMVLGASDRLPAAWSDDELLEGMSAAQRLRGVADALELSMLAEVDVRELPRKRLQWASTADWFTHLTGGFRRDGRRRVRLARALACGLHRDPGGGA